MNRRTFIRAAVVGPVAAAFGASRAGFFKAVQALPGRTGWLHFGKGTPVLLHGREQVLSQADFEKWNRAAERMAAVMKEGMPRIEAALEQFERNFRLANESRERMLAILAREAERRLAAGA